MEEQVGSAPLSTVDRPFSDLISPKRLFPQSKLPGALRLNKIFVYRPPSIVANSGMMHLPGRLAYPFSPKRLVILMSCAYLVLKL